MAAVKRNKAQKTVLLTIMDPDCSGAFFRNQIFQRGGYSRIVALLFQKCVQVVGAAGGTINNPGPVVSLDDLRAAGAAAEREQGRAVIVGHRFIRIQSAGLLTIDPHRCLKSDLQAAAGSDISVGISGFSLA